MSDQIDIGTMVAHLQGDSAGFVDSMKQGVEAAASGAAKKEDDPQVIALRQQIALIKELTQWDKIDKETKQQATQEQEKANALIKELETPQEKYNDQIRALNADLKDVHITQDQFNKASEKAGKELQEVLGRDYKLNIDNSGLNAMQAGSAEAAEALSKQADIIGASFNPARYQAEQDAAAQANRPQFGPVYDQNALVDANADAKQAAFNDVVSGKSAPTTANDEKQDKANGFLERIAKGVETHAANGGVTVQIANLGSL